MCSEGSKVTETLLEGSLSPSVLVPSSYSDPQESTFGGKGQGLSGLLRTLKPRDLPGLHSESAVELESPATHRPHGCLQREGASAEFLLCAGSQPSRTKQTGSQRVKAPTEHTLGRAPGRLPGGGGIQLHTDV